MANPQSSQINGTILIPLAEEVGRLLNDSGGGAGRGGGD